MCNLLRNCFTTREGNCVKPGEEGLGLHGKAVEADQSEKNNKDVEKREDAGAKGDWEEGGEAVDIGDKRKKRKKKNKEKSQAQQEMDSDRFRQWTEHLYQCLEIIEEQKTKAHINVTPDHFQNAFVVATSETPPSDEALLRYQAKPKPVEI